MFQLLSRVTAKLAPATPPKLKGYASFAAALADSNSYEDQRLIAVVSEKTRRYREALRNSPSRTIDSRQTVQNMFVLSQVEPQHVTRTPVTAVTASIFTKQETDLAAHGPGKLPNSPAGKSSQPLTLLNDATLFDAVPAAYEIVFRFEESGHRTLLIDDRAVEVRDVGFLARKRVYSHT
jgi:hypothetical protein